MSHAETQKDPPRIFISYRIADTFRVADRLAAELKRRFGDHQVFFDRRTIKPGDTWPSRIETAVKGATVVLVLMGKQWLTEQDRYGQRRLDVPGDWVRSEVEAALAKEALVIPLLVDGAEPPPKEAFSRLPSIAALASYQATPLRSAEWDSDFRDLVERLAKLVPSQDRPPQRPRAKPVNLPYGSLGTLFKGREDLLADIHTGFAGESGHAQAIIAQHAIHGLGGIGKTRAAVEYAWRHGEDYSALLFLTAQSPEDLRTKLSALCDPLGLARGVTEEDERVRATLGWLADSANTGWRILCRLGESAAADRFTESDTTHWSTPSPRVNSAARSLYSRVAARLHA